MSIPYHTTDDATNQLIYELEEYIYEYRVYWYDQSFGTTIEVLGAAGDWRIEDLAKELIDGKYEYEERSNNAYIDVFHETAN